MKHIVLAIVLVALGVMRSADRFPDPRHDNLADLKTSPPDVLGAPDALDATMAPVIDALWSRFDTQAAQQHVQFISQYWRLAGNAGYDASLDRVHARLAGPRVSFYEKRQTTPEVFFEEYPNTESGGWDHSVGTLAIVGSGGSDDVVLSREKERLALCINSFSTPAAGITAPLVDVGRGDRDEDYAGKNLKGAVVLGDADAGQLWRRAVVAHGAIGVVSTALARYVSPDAPGARPTPRDEWDILQWSSIPYDATRKGFGFKATPRAAARLRRALAPSPPYVRVTIASSYSSKPVRTLVAEIPGRVAPEERVVVAAHVQEPGANDNASGVATLAELVVALQSGIRAGRISPPGRTLTFLFLNEIGGSRRWLQDHPDAAKRVRYMFSMDMTGEDTAKTGGTFLVERWPDPGAVWDRPWDPHSEWGRGNVRADQLKGDLINDAHLAVSARVARKTGWVVKSNPYEGGSDHTVFGAAGVPSVLDWHFTDRYYHTNFDTPDKSSAAEMRNVGVSAGATAWLLASADASTALAVAELVANAGKARVALEEREGTKLAGADEDPGAAGQREATIVSAWRRWYGEAVRSASRLVVGPAPPEFSSRLDALAAPFGVRGADSVRSADRGPGPRKDVADLETSPPYVREGPRQGSAAEGALSVCGADMSLPLPIPVRWDTVALAGDSRGFTPCPNGVHTGAHREAREAAVLAAAARHRDPELRRLAAQAIGRHGLPSSVAVSRRVTTDPATGQMVVGAVSPTLIPGPLSQLLSDPDALVRREAASAIGEALSGAAGELARAQPLTPEALANGRTVLEARLKVEKDAGVAGMILETIGRLKYADDSTRDKVEAFLVAQAAGPAERVLGATKGLEALIRANPRRTISARARDRLRRLAVDRPAVSPVATRAGGGSAPASGDADTLARSRRLALMALQQARDDDIETLMRAAGDADWQVRRLVALRLDLERPEFNPIIARLFDDTAFQVRYELLGPIARQAARTRDCTPLVRAFDDPEVVVVLRAIDLVPSACAEQAAAIKRLTAWAEGLRSAQGPDNWHVPAHALASLARLRPDAARPFFAGAVDHQTWQVRATAAAAAVSIADEAAARRLAGDREPNVRTIALDSLVRLKSAGVFRAATEALGTDDYQLLRAAAIALRGTPEAERTDAVNALLGTLRRLTEKATDTSRDPRVAIFERLAEILPAERAPDLVPFREDFDAKVREAAASLIAKLTQAERQPLAGVKYRYPYQPSSNEMAAPPTSAVIQMEGGGIIHLELLVDQAPVTVARFAQLARSGYYDGLTFHRVVPNFVIQGGSPGANEYVGVSRYMRDEVGTAPHTRGAVGISTRGRDTGDGQIFIDLVDLPRLDHEYTVFARVTSGLDVVDRILEGARMVSVTVK